MAGSSTRTLAVVTPAYEGHLRPWTALLNSIIFTESHNSEATCAFGQRRFHTVLTSEREATLFRHVLADALRNHSVNAAIAERFHVNTLHEVLTRSNAGVGADPAATDAFVSRLFSPFRTHGKNWLQSIKKLHGCAAFATGPGDACFLIDAESRVLRHSACHAASVYLERKSVIVVPMPPPPPVASKKADASASKPVKPLGGPMLSSVQASTARHSVLLLKDGVRAALATAPPPLRSFYAMNVYHWYVFATRAPRLLAAGDVATRVRVQGL